MLDATILYSVSATLYAIGMTMFVFFRKRITPDEIVNLLDKIYEAKQETSDGGKEITADEVISIVETFVDAIKK